MVTLNIIKATRGIFCSKVYGTLATSAISPCPIRLLIIVSSFKGRCNRDPYTKLGTEKSLVYYQDNKVIFCSLFTMDSLVNYVILALAHVFACLYFG